MKKIIFGAGNYGRMAAEYWGEDVAFFADNNKEKVGKKCCDKEILSFDRYLDIQQDYETIIAVSAYSQIAKQLLDAGIQRFTFFSPQYNCAMEKLRVEVRNKNGIFVLVGRDIWTEALIRDILQCGIEETALRVTDIQDGIGEHDFIGIPVIRFQEAISVADYFIIAASENAYANGAYVNGKKNEKQIVINPYVQKKYYETPNVVFNPYGNENYTVTEEQWNNFNRENRVFDEIEQYAKSLADAKPLFEHVEIETYNRCNGVCDFCPVSKNNEKREEKWMDEELFHSIINQLAELNYAGRLALFSNNEPFLDERILEFHRFARQKLPLARMHLFTNGTVLTLEKFIEVIKYLDELIIDNYNQELNLNKHSKEIADYCEEHPKLKQKVTIVLRKPHEILSTRGGDAPNRCEMPTYDKVKCVLPFKQMIIRPDGKVSLCCNDPYGKCTLGDLSKSSIMDVWNGKAYENVRNLLLQGRGKMEHCKNCDSFIIF